MTEEEKSKRGGRRPGAGRSNLYGAPLTDEILVELTLEASRAIVGWCRKKRVPVATLLRESALIEAGLESLGVGIHPSGKVWAKARVREDRSTAAWPVRFTVEQGEALRQQCSRMNVAPKHHILGAALKIIGRGDLAPRVPAMMQDE